MHSTIDALASGGEAGTLGPKERMAAPLLASLRQVPLPLLPLFALRLKLFHVLKRRFRVEP